MRESESTRRAKRGSDSVVRGDGPKVASMEVVQLANKKIDVVRGEGIVLLQIIKRNEREGSREIPPKDMNGGAGVLRRSNDVHHRGVKRKGRGDVNLNNNQGIVVDL